MPRPRVRFLVGTQGPGSERRSFHCSAFREQQLAIDAAKARVYMETRTGVDVPLDVPLLEALQDGVMLCKLANAVQPGVISDFVTDPKPPQALENVNNFLMAVPRMGVEATPFEASELVNRGRHTDAVAQRVVHVVLSLMEQSGLRTSWVQGHAIPLDEVTTIYQEGIGDPGAKVLANSLKGNTLVHELYIWRDSLTGVGAKALTEVLIRDECIRVLDLYMNNIGDEGAECMGDLLKASTALMTLGLYGNGIGNAGVASLGEGLKGNRGLQSLILSHNTFTAHGCRVLCASLRANKTLTSLNLMGNKIEDEGVRALGELLRSQAAGGVPSPLTHLILSGCGITDEGSRILAQILKEFPSSLCVLDLAANKMTLDGASALLAAFQCCTTVMEADVRGTRVPQAIVEDLETFLSLRRAASTTKRGMKEEE